MKQQIIAEKASKDYNKVLEIDYKAAKAGIKLDKTAMRRLDKIISTCFKQLRRKVILNNIKAIMLIERVNKKLKYLGVVQQLLLESKKKRKL
ncbi:hypothetical protein A1E_00555 [Rickettsia canadensis str. McKiel]|uniref:Uncharacterized protein n=1 Tax=Rickettsia canadensis (strain McKiel) TaxID=293613 RepID=A8EXH6_RICCK|nr:hypothetical protein [Rickettsia canadensis]ABV73059.1 hypothetical protein A1E_00555 [Rickettsia canadensis str. McKiel]